MIEFQDVTVCYEPDKRHPVRSLDGISLKIERGDWVFLVGPSGAGKSSLLRLVYAGMKAQSGRVVVDGADISALAPREVPALRRKIGIVFQDFQLLSEKTAWENVAFALRVIGTPQSVIVREVPRALETVGLTHRAEALPHELSGGEQQRIAIARAIVNNPPILLTDEPTGNLDPQTAREVGQLLTKINFERGTTIVMATHDGAFVDELARRVVRLKAGRVVSDCNPGTYGSDEEETVPDLAPIFLQPPVVAPPVAEAPTVVATPVVVAPVVVEAPPVVLPEVMVPEVMVPEVMVSEVMAPVAEVPQAEIAVETPLGEPVQEPTSEAVEILPVEEMAVESLVEVPVEAAATEEIEAEVETPEATASEVAAPEVAAPETEEVIVAEESAPEPSKTVIPSGNWAQIAATAPKPVSSNVPISATSTLIRSMACSPKPRRCWRPVPSKNNLCRVRWRGASRRRFRRPKTARPAKKSQPSPIRARRSVRRKTRLCNTNN